MDAKTRKLLQAAKHAKANAYAPYSNFKVGAAVMTDTGKIYAGCNVENTSYGLTICAERNAVFQMVADGETKIKEILVIGDTDDFLPPCGACRQVIAEFADPFTRVYMCNRIGDFKQTLVEDLIPFTFFLNNESSVVDGNRADGDEEEPDQEAFNQANFNRADGNRAEDDDRAGNIEAYLPEVNGD